MQTKKYIRIAVIAILITLALLIPAQRAGSTQQISVSTPEAPAEDEEPALHTPPATSTLASDITKTIAILETGGTLDCSMKGLSGERGCHQFLPSTWSAYSLEVYGYVAEQTPENAEYVTLWKVQNWLDQGIDARGIFLIWNTGQNNGCSSGINWLGVPYDSCAYVEDALNILSEVTHSL